MTEPDPTRTSPARRDADPTDGRDESEDERMDRNWNELLQELRVTQTGTQVLTGFLLTIAFQPRFADLDQGAQVIYLSLVVAATLTTALALAPVHLHRVLFRTHSKAALVQMTHGLLRGTLLGLSVVITGTVLLIFEVVLDRKAALIAGAAGVAVLVAVAVIPNRLALRWKLRSGGTSAAGDAVTADSAVTQSDSAGGAHGDDDEHGDGTRPAGRPR